MNPLALAYLGDAVFEVLIRQFLLAGPNHKPNYLQRASVRYVSAKAQARGLESLLPLLTEEERDVLRRGRNAKSGTVPRNADVADYRYSTALECLIGYLYLKQRFDRLETIVTHLVRPSEVAEGRRDEAQEEL